jgi:hypothetical protein
MIRVSTRSSEHLVVAGRLGEPERLVGPAQRLPPVRHSRPGDLQRPIHGPVPAGFQVQVELGLPAANRAAAAVLSAASSASSCADPTCSIWREPRREEYTICTAVAPEAVLTVRT